MDELTLDINSSLLTPEEAEALFNEGSGEGGQVEKPDEKEKDTPAEEENPSEKVGGEEKIETEENAVKPGGDGSSPAKFYSSIASALRNDGIFPDFTDDDIDAVNTPEDFAELFEKAVNARLDERQRRIDSALGNGVAPDDIKMYEQTISYLDSITEEALESETDEGEALRKQLIFNDLINRGYSQERANREIEKSFKSGSDIDDAKDALKELGKFYKTGYENVRKQAAARAEEERKARQKSADDFKKLVIDGEITIGDSQLDKRTRQRIYDSVVKPVYKDPDTGRLLTQVQKFQKENPMEFLKQLGMWFTLTDGGKDFSGLSKGQVRAEKNKSIKELERKINSSALGPDGSLRYMSGTQIDNESLLSDGWKVDLGQ